MSTTSSFSSNSNPQQRKVGNTSTVSNATPNNNSSLVQKPRTGTTSGSSSYAESYARQEQFFKQVMKQREDTFKKLEKVISVTAKEIGQCQDKV